MSPVTSRPPTVGDAALILPLVLACDEAVAGTSDSSLDEIASMLAFPGVDNEMGGRLVLDESGAAVGWLWTELDEVAAEIFVDVFARDAAVSTWLFGLGVDHAREVAAATGGSLSVRAGCFAQDHEYADVIRSHGLVVDRTFLRMRRDLAPAAPYVAPTPPAGVSVEVATSDDAGLRVLHRLHEESFTDHWNHTGRPFDEWLARVEASTGDDPAQRYIARVDGEPAGLLVADESMREHGESYVRTLGVLSEFRGRGIAKALLANAFAEAGPRGYSRVGLTVDGASPTGAKRLYESVGMTVFREILLWHRTVG